MHPTAGNVESWCTVQAAVDVDEIWASCDGRSHCHIGNLPAES